MSPTLFIYLLLFSLLLAGAAAATEWGAQRPGATRHIWTVAIALSILGPAAAMVWHAVAQRGSAAYVISPNALTSSGIELAGVPVAETQPASAWSKIAQSAASLRSGAERVVESMPQWSSDAGKLALTAWLLLSLALCAWLVAGLYSLRRSQRQWTRATIDGVDVDVSSSVGPAVFGFTSHRIVLPEWAVQMEMERRRLIIAHETEHISARDPQRLALALVTLVLMPWNVALWWCAARLRRAIELDCDSRVLRRFPDAREYGYVLLDVASRGRSSGPLAIPMVSLLRLPSELELRLRAMSRTRKVGYRSATIGAVLALIGVSAAFTTPVPWPSHAGEPVADTTGGDQQIVNAYDDVTWINWLNQVQSGHAGTYRANDTVPTTSDRSKRRMRDSLVTDSIARATGHKVSREQANGSTTYLPNQVDKPVRARPGSPTPEYPADLRKQGVKGEVRIAFVVDTFGRVEPGSMRLQMSTDRRFATAVLTALPNMLFIPAEIGGRKVKQLVQQPFMFTISGPADQPNPNPNPNQTYFPYQVDKPVAYRAGSPMPQYPAALRDRKVQGEVQAEFVVDTLGHVESGSIKVVKSTNQLFTDAVLKTLPNMLFVPAESHGRKVKQLVQQPFTFAIPGSHG